MAGLEVEITRDALLRGRLSLYQPRAGYRFNVDALWLAAFAISCLYALKREEDVVAQRIGRLSRDFVELGFHEDRLLGVLAHEFLAERESPRIGRRSSGWRPLFTC